MLHEEVTAIRCAHGDTVVDPLAYVNIEVIGRHLEVEAAVSSYSSIIGTEDIRVFA